MEFSKKGAFLVRLIKHSILFASINLLSKLASWSEINNPSSILVKKFVANLTDFVLFIENFIN
jgi:hypothetical protein